MRATILWTETCTHSATLEVPDGTDLDDQLVRDDLLDQALELSGTLEAVTERTIDNAYEEGDE